MKKLLRQIHMWLFPPISRKRAVAIAQDQCTPKPEAFCVYGSKPTNVYIYNLPEEPCWFIYTPWNDGKDGYMLRSSHLMLISKLNGEVLYDGSAHDEG